MRIVYPYILFTGFLILSSCSGQKLFIKNDDGKFKIKEGMSVVPTMKGQEYQFNERCINVCMDCDPELENSRGIVDSIRAEGIYLKYGIEFEYDTLAFMQARSMKKKERRKDLYKVIRNRPGMLMVYKRPLQYRYEFIWLDSISYLTYSETVYCNRMAKMKKPFSKPNKIYRAALTGAKKVKVH